MPPMCATRILLDRTTARKRALHAAEDRDRHEAEDGWNIEDLLAELLDSIEFGHDLDQPIEEIIAGIRQDLDQGALF